MPTRLRPHKVALLASAVGLLALLVLDFGTIAVSRIATGDPVGLFAALGPARAAAALVLWAASVALAFTGTKSPRFAFARGVTAGAIIVMLLWLSGAAASGLLAHRSPIARYSIGGGVWLSAFCAFAIIVSSRRDVGEGTIRSFAVAALAPVGLVALMLAGGVSRLGIAMEYRNVSGDFWLWTGQHLAYSAVSVVVAVLLGVSLGVLAHGVPRFAGPVFAVSGVLQTIPGLAMIGILAVPLGLLVADVPGARALGIGVLGWAPVVIALTLYALLTIIRNTYVGLDSVSPAVVDAARGMGLSRRQILMKVQIPLSAPVVFSGIRTAAQQTIGNATLGVFVAAGTLGRPIIGGVSQAANDLVLLGSIALVALALGTDVAMRGLERLVTPRQTGAVL